MATNSKLSEALKGNTNAAKSHAKRGMESIQNAGNHAKVTAGKVFASTAEKTKAGYEAVDKTLKYGAAGAAIGAATAVGGVGGARLATNMMGSATRAALVGGGVGAGAGYLSAKSVEKHLPDMSASENRTLKVASTLNTGALGALGGALGYMGLKALGAPTPAKVAAGAIIGAGIGGYKGYKADRAEAAARKKR